MRKQSFLRTNDLTWGERLQMRKYAMKNNYFPDRNYRFMTMTDFVQEFLRRERENAKV